MKIAGIAHAVPHAEITNAWTLAQIRKHNADLTPAQLSTLEANVGEFLKSAGTDRRYCLADGEKALDVLLRAGREALAVAHLAPEDIEFLIYTGVGRGWIEPAMATAVQAELGLTNATGFDVLDACASWLRALHLAHSLIQSKAYRRGLIVNCECGLHRAYDAWALKGGRAADYRLATYTIGEAATATVVTDADEHKNYYFTFKTFPEHYRLCMLPLSSLRDFWLGPEDDRYAPGEFFASSRELLTMGVRKTIETFQADARLREQTYDICFGHSASVKASDVILQRLGLADIFVQTHPLYGNTVSASVPLAMSLAAQDGRLKRGHRALAIVASAGLTVGFGSFTY